MEHINRYIESSLVHSYLDPLEDVLSWVHGLSSVNYVKDLLKSKFNLIGNPNVNLRSESVAKLVGLACKYLEQADRSPKEISFLPLYYACLNLLKVYIVLGPYALKLRQNRHHGATYNSNKDVQSLNDDYIRLKSSGAIPLFYRTVTRHNIVPQTLSMRDIYPYIIDVSAEYQRVTKSKLRCLPFKISVQEQGDKQRVIAECVSQDEKAFRRVQIGTLQAFEGIKRENKNSKKLVSKWYHKSNTASMRLHIHPAMLYNRCDPAGMGYNFYNLVPFSNGELLMPEELPIILAFFHMSNVVRYNPEGLQNLMDSKYWPVLLVLRRQGLYRLLSSFWSFMNQTCTHILPI